MAGIPHDQRLDGWKAIANFLGRERTTAIRWANERGMPVHRFPGGQTGSVYAIRTELDAWLAGNRDEPQPLAQAEERSKPQPQPQSQPQPQPEPQPQPPWRSTARGPTLVLALVAAFAIVLALSIRVLAPSWLGPKPPAAHSMMVRLSGFWGLSADLPPTMRETIAAEIAAAFTADGIVGISTAAKPASGMAPAYSLGGTIYRVGSMYRVITRLTNERSGVVLWSDSVDYAADQVARVPKLVAVDAGTVVRCGLSGAATYGKVLPDRVLSNYMQYCQQYWAYGGSKTLRFAQLVVAAIPDFSWGWSALGNGFKQAADAEADSRRADALRAAGRRAEDKALALDPGNSEALAHKAYLIDPHDWVGQEALFKRAIAAQPLDCGCEHYGYGLKLQAVGRLGAAIEQFRAATDMLALWPLSQLALARTLSAVGQDSLAAPYFTAAIDLTRERDYGPRLAISEGVETGAYAAAMTALRDPQLQMGKESRAALLSGYEALASADAQARIKAIGALTALTDDRQSSQVATLLAALGANRDALRLTAERPWLFWRRSMRGVLNEPGFPAVAKQLGLMTYWRTSRTKPDICLTESEPPFCRMI